MVGAAARRPVQSKRKTIAPARTASQAPASTRGQASASIGTSKGKGPGPLARPGANSANIAERYKGPECSNGYRREDWCDSSPDWHTLTVLISSAARHNPHRRGSVITFRIGGADRRDTYRRRVTVPDWHKCKRTTQPDDKPGLWMGQPPIRGAYMISGAYASAPNDKFCLYEYKCTSENENRSQQGIRP
jgi:hypothetical protein